MATIQGIYLALFGRPADPAGLAYFNAETQNGADLTAIGDLAATDEYQSRFEGMSNTAIINSIYQSLFGRDGEPAGVAFFVDALEDGTYNINNIAIAILDGAQNDDLATVNAKIAAANLFTAQLDLDAEVDAYSGNSAAAIGRAFIDGVDKDDAGTSAEADAAIELLIDAGQGAGGGGGGGGGVPVGGVNPGSNLPTFTMGQLLAMPAGTEPANFNFVVAPESLQNLTVDNAERIEGLVADAANGATYLPNLSYTISDTFANFAGIDSSTYADADYVTVSSNGNISGLAGRDGLTLIGTGNNDQTITVPAGSGGNDARIIAGNGVDTINLQLNSGDDVVVLGFEFEDRDTINNFELNFDYLELGPLSVNVGDAIDGAEFVEVGAPFGNAVITIAGIANAAVVEFAFDVGGDAVLGSGSDPLFDGIRNSGGDSATDINVTANWSGYLVAYDSNGGLLTNASAYIYSAVDDNGNGQLDVNANEVELVAIITNVGVGNIDAFDFTV
jgi:hypothetical protein